MLRRHKELEPRFRRQSHFGEHRIYRFGCPQNPPPVWDSSESIRISATIFISADLVL